MSRQLCHLAPLALIVLIKSFTYAQVPQTLSVPPDSPRWDLQGEAKVAEYQGRKCLSLDGAAALLKDFEMQDGVIDVDVATPARRGFFGIQFRVADDGATAEWVYLRQHKSGLPDAMQYTPVLHTVHGPLDPQPLAIYHQLSKLAPQVGLISLSMNQRKPGPELP